MVDATDLKSVSERSECRFKSGSGHQMGLGASGVGMLSDMKIVGTRDEKSNLGETAMSTISRRMLLAGVAALGGGMFLEASSGYAQPSAARLVRVDVHHHLTPPDYIAELGPKGKNLLEVPTLGWTPAKAIEEMDEGGVATSITSITTPGLWFGDPASAQRLARACNDYAAKLISDYPRRFAMFVNLPLPDIEGSLKEIAYGLDVLKADGVSLFTSYGDKWLGDPAFDPVFDELNRRKAIVYTHPTLNDCCRNLVPGVAPSSIEYGTDTSRAIARMILSGASQRYPDIRLIWSHAGGTMPFLIGRFMRIGASERYAKTLPQGFLPEMQRFYYDTAQAANGVAMGALKKVVPVSHILFGTDFPYLRAELHVKGLREAGLFTPKELAAIDHGNIARLLPKYKA
jgi:6-methylsalicylate decarboxylase